MLVVEGGEGDSLDPGSGVEGATYCTKLCFGRRKGREGNLQSKEYSLSTFIDGIWLLIATSIIIHSGRHVQTKLNLAMWSTVAVRKYNHGSKLCSYINRNG